MILAMPFFNTIKIVVGEYLRKDFRLYTYNLDNINQEIIYFKPLDAFAFQPVPIDLIKVLKLNDGTFLFNTERTMYTEKKLFCHS